MASKKIDNFKIGMQTKEGDCCPECNANWDGGDILEFAIKKKDDGEDYFVDLSDKELIEYAEAYGWTPEAPRRWGNVIGVELPHDDPERHDGVSYWACPECMVAWSRWTGKRTERFIKIKE